MSSHSTALNLSQENYLAAVSVSVSLQRNMEAERKATLIILQAPRSCPGRRQSVSIVRHQVQNLKPIQRRGSIDHRPQNVAIDIDFQQMLDRRIAEGREGAKSDATDQQGDAITPQVTVQNRKQKSSNPFTAKGRRPTNTGKKSSVKTLKLASISKVIAFISIHFDNY